MNIFKFQRFILNLKVPIVFLVKNIFLFDFLYPAHDPLLIAACWKSDGSLKTYAQAYLAK